MFRSILFTIRLVIQVLKNEVTLLTVRYVKCRYFALCLRYCITHMMMIDINRYKGVALR
jgi:hypothetical protein